MGIEKLSSASAQPLPSRETLMTFVIIGNVGPVKLIFTQVVCAMFACTSELVVAPIRIKEVDVKFCEFFYGLFIGTMLKL